MIGGGADGKIAAEVGLRVEDEARDLPVDGDAILLRGDDVPQPVAVGVDDVQAGKSVADLDPLAALGAAAHLHVHFQLGSFFVAVADMAENGERPQRWHQQVVAVLSGEVVHQADAGQLAVDRLVEEGWMLDELARRRPHAAGEGLRAHSARRHQKKVVGASSAGWADVEGAGLGLVDGERQVGTRREDAAAVPEDGEGPLLVRRIAGAVDGEEILAPVAVEVGRDDGGHLSLDGERLYVEPRRCRGCREQQEENGHVDSIDRNPCPASSNRRVAAPFGRGV